MPWQITKGVHDAGEGGASQQVLVMHVRTTRDLGKGKGREGGETKKSWEKD